MNAIQLRLRTDELIDRTKTARHSDVTIYNAINAACMWVVKDRVEAIRKNRNYSVQSSERLRAELYPLVKKGTVTALINTDTVPYPTDYYYYLALWLTVDSVKQLCYSTSFDTIGELQSNPFRKPTSTKIYFNEYSSGLQLYYGTRPATLGAFELWYLKTPNVVSIGNESKKITDGGTLSTGTTYYVYEEAVYDGTTYYEGETFLAGGVTTLTSGIVIANQNIVNSDLPANMHEEICVKTAAILMGTVEDYQKKASFNNDVEEN